MVVNQELLTLFVQQPVGQLKRIYEFRAFVQQPAAQIERIEQELEMEIKKQLAGLKYE